MAGKILRIVSNDLYGNVDDRKVSVFACFQHTKYMNNYVVFTIQGDSHEKLCYGSVHFRNNSIVVFSIKEDMKQYIDQFLEEYMSDKLNEFKLLDMDMIEKIELVSYNDMKYDKVSLLDSKSITKVDEIVVEEKEKKPIFAYFLLILLVLVAIGITILYLKPEWFTIKNKELDCVDNLYDNNIGLSYDINKNIKFDRDDKVNIISVTRDYVFSSEEEYYNFKENNTQNEYFNNGEGYKYIDDELRFRVFYEEKSVIDDYDEMLIYLKKEGYRCIEKEYEE